MADYKRFTAKKVSAEDIIRSNFREEENTLVINESKEAKRIRLMATVIKKFISDDEKYGFLVLDDSTETVRTKAFREDVNRIKSIGEGDIIDLIGRIDKYEDEVYIRPEIVKRIENPSWVLVRKLELLEGNGGHMKDKKESQAQLEGNKEQEKEKTKKLTEEKSKREPEEEVVVDEVKTPEEEIYGFLNEKNKAGFDELVKEFDYDEEKIKDILKNLMQDGRVFEPRKKVYKSL